MLLYIVLSTATRALQDEDVESDEIVVGDVESLEALLAPAAHFPGYDASLDMDGDEAEDDPDLQDEPVLQVDIQVRPQAGTHLYIIIMETTHS